MRLLLALILFANAVAAQSLLVQANQAHSRKELAKERELLRAAATQGADNDRAEAERRLALLAWRLYKNDDEARAHFDRAAALPAGLSETLSARARMETARGRYESARGLSRSALECATESRTRDDARIAFAAATVEEAFAAGRSAAAQEALDGISAVVRAEPGRFVPSRLMYGLALLLHDEARVQEALRSYYWGGKLLPLYPEAGLAGDPSEVVAYARFCRRAKEIADEHYRRQTLGEVEWDALRKPVMDEAHSFWPKLATDEEIFKYLRDRFGAEIAFFRWGFEFGHRIRDEERTVEQYGRVARVRPIVLDSMISNGHVTWYSDGRESIGGWADPPAMISLRRDDALLAWMELTDPQRKEKFERALANATEVQDAEARKNPFGYIEALEMRLWNRALRELLAEQQAKGLGGADLRLAFLGEFERRSTACVDAHEARHIIDVDVSSGVLREMNAALSQIAFGGHPAHCLRSMFGPNVGRPDNGSGEGYGRIMKGITAWMDIHAKEIKGFDRARPTLPQFDLMTEEQIRAAFRAMDPLAAPKT
jgi:hypothetical protein